MAQDELEQSLQKLESLANSDPEEIRKKVWSSMSVIADLILRAKDANFQSGWAAKVVDHQGNPIFSSEESEGLEGTAISVVKPMFDRSLKAGGALTDEQQVALEAKVASLEADLAKEKRTVQEKLKEKAAAAKEYMKTMTPEKAKQLAKDKAAALKEKLAGLSLDETYFKAKKAISDMDEYALKTFPANADETGGPLKLFRPDTDESFHIPVPPPAIPYLGSEVEIPHKAASLGITLLIELIRLMTSFGPLRSDITRKLTTVALIGVNLLQADWKGAALSSMGLFGPASLILGVLGKLALFSLARLDKASLDGLLLNTFKSAKSVPVGITAWALSVFATEEIRTAINEKFVRVNSILDTHIAALEAKADPKYETILLELKERKPSMSNLLAIQSIANHPAMACSAEFVSAIDEITKYDPGPNKEKPNPDDTMVVRLFVELCNIPLTKDMRESACLHGTAVPLEQSIQQYIKEKTGTVATAAPPSTTTQ